MRKILLVTAVLMAIASFAGSALAKDLSGFYSVQIEKWEQEVCKYGDCERFYTGERVVQVKPMYLADSQVRKLQAEGKLLESASSKAKTKPEKVRRAKSAVKKANVAKSAPKKRPHIAKRPTEFKRPKLVSAIPIPSDSECTTIKVVKGDTVIGLAKKLGTTPEMVWALNHHLIKNPNLIKIGWNLKVPAPDSSLSNGSSVPASSGVSNVSVPTPVITGLVLMI